MVHARVDGGGEQIVGRRHGVDVTGEVEVELFHRDDLGVPSASCASLDAEGGALGGLADAREGAASHCERARGREGGRADERMSERVSGCTVQ